MPRYHRLADRAAVALFVGFCMLWSTQAHSFYTVHKIKKLEMYITFQAGLGNTDNDTINASDILNELSAGRPNKRDVLAAVINCNDPYQMTVVVWNTDVQDVAAGSSMIPMYVIDYVTESGKNKESSTVLLDAQPLFGNGYITAQVKFSEIKEKRIPPGADPTDNTFCVSSLQGLSIAGYIDTDQGFGIVWGGMFIFGKPIASITSFTVTNN
jgi:hypothetical protein